MWGDPSITKIGHDLKRWVTALRWHGIAVAGTLLDTRLAHQLIESEGAHDLALLAEHYLHYAPAASAESLAGSPPAAGTPAAPGIRELALFAGERADLTAGLLDALQHEIDRLEEREVWQRIEVPLLPLLVEMEYAGVAVRVDVLRDYSIQLENEIANHEADLYRLAGGEFNLNSPKQLGELLFEQFKISDKPKRTRTGQYSTTEQELTRLADRHPIIPAILEYRVVQKLKSTYVDALPAAGVARDRTYSHHLQSARSRHRPAQLRESQPAEHPDPNRQGARDSTRVRGARWRPRPAVSRLLPDRAADHGRDHRRPGAGGGVRG